MRVSAGSRTFTRLAVAVVLVALLNAGAFLGCAPPPRIVRIPAGECGAADGAANDNRDAAGDLREGMLTLRLDAEEALEARW